MSGSYIPQGISDTLGDLVGLYSQVEAIKLNNALAKARASAAAFGEPTANKNLQNNQNSTGVPVVKVNANKDYLMIGGGVALVALLVYLVVK